MKLEIAPPVKEALDGGHPVVALETTVITHGMEFPDNIETVMAMESAIREEGACPATIGIIRGRITVGLTVDQIEAFGTAEKDSIAKCSRRDFPVITSSEQDGSLTVAGTMIAAHAAGIPIMATGGIGGVHRGHSFDVSADLMELGRTPVAVVCAGAKAILDLPATLEVLETQGVPLVGFGSRNLPAFYAADSGLGLPAYVESLEEVVDVLRAWRALDACNGILITVPVPEKQALDPGEVSRSIDAAVHEADERGVSGNQLTPFLLKRVVDLTGGRALAANKALLINNAKTAAVLARHLAMNDGDK
jgi:pseudouridine-5'-phosphate glycosidase